MKLNFEWKTKKGQYQTGSSLYLNKIMVASYEYNSSRSKSDSHDDNDWTGTTLLPQANRQEYSSNENTLKLKLQHIVELWFKETTNPGDMEITGR